MAVTSITTPGKTTNKYGQFVYCDLEVDGQGFSGPVYVKIHNQKETKYDVEIPGFSMLRLRIRLEPGMGSGIVVVRADDKENSGQISS